MTSNGTNLDDIDRRIIGFLRQNGRIPFTTIANALEVAEGTVRKRVNQLMENGVLRVVGVTSPEKMGIHTSAIVGVETTGNDVEGVVAKLSELPEVRYMAVCAGTYDIILEVAVKSNEALFVFLTQTLRAIPGVTGSDTSLVMKVCKQRFDWEAPDDEGRDPQV